MDSSVKQLLPSSDAQRHAQSSKPNYSGVEVLICVLSVSNSPEDSTLTIGINAHTNPITEAEETTQNELPCPFRMPAFDGRLVWAHYFLYWQ